MQSAEDAWTQVRKNTHLPTLAARLHLKRQAVYAWTKVPEKRLRLVSIITGVPKERLRPDLYPADPWSAL